MLARQVGQEKHISGQSLSQPSIKMSQHHQRWTSLVTPASRITNEGLDQPVPACDMSGDKKKKKKDALAELNTLDYVRAPGGSVMWLEGERGGERARILPSLPAIPKCSQTHKKYTARRKKENKGKRGRGSCCRTQLRHVPMQRGLGSPVILP